MNRFTKFLFLSFTLVLLGALALPGAAQDVAPGEGGIIIANSFAGDPNSFNPLLSTTTTESHVADMILPDIFSTDPATRYPSPGARNDEDSGLTLSMEISEDGLTYTFHLRDDMVWSDGTPVTSADYKYTFDALASGETSSPRVSVLETVDSVEAPDPQTIVINLKQATCRAIEEFDDFGILPAHEIQAQVGDDLSLIDTMDYNLNPTITAGPFNFGALLPGEQVSFVANPDYIEPVLPTGYIIKNVPDQTVALEQFLAGEVNALDTTGGVSQERMAEVRALSDAGEVQTYEFIDDGLTFMMVNLADPGNPQNGLDDDGNPIEQGHHFFFGDVRVRQAVAMAMNKDDIISGAANGEGEPVTTFGSPALWGYNPNIEDYPYDPDAALALLAEAGWVDDDNDPSTPLVATEDALYAEPGTTASIKLLTNAGNAAREASGVIIQDQWGQIGIDVEFEAQEFGALVDGPLFGQTFDAIIIGFTNIAPDTDARDVFTPSADGVGGGGFNVVSYNNPEVTQMYQDALLLPGCDQGERQAIYWDIGQQLHDDLPWIGLFAPKVMYAASNTLEGINPFAENRWWNIASVTALAP